MALRTALRAVALSTVIASSGAAVVYLSTTRYDHVATAAVAPAGQPGSSAAYRFERLTAPARTVVRDNVGAIIATLTDGARTAALTGPPRTFSEPGETQTVTTSAWVRLLPQPWQNSGEHATWFAPWLKTALADRGDDLLAVAAEYLGGAPAVTDGRSVRFRGNASFPHPDRPADFLDYLGLRWTFADGTTESPHPERYGAIDSAGLVRLVYGYRLGYPLRPTNGRGTGLPRQPAAMATLDAGTVIIPDHHTTPADRLLLLPGDLLFFDDRRAGAGDVDHVGIFLGLDDNGHPRLVSSRKKADGPTFGDVGPTSLLGQGGRFGPGLRSARRL